MRLLGAAHVTGWQLVQPALSALDWAPRTPASVGVRAGWSWLGAMQWGKMHWICLGGISPWTPEIQVRCPACDLTEQRVALSHICTGPMSAAGGPCRLAQSPRVSIQWLKQSW